MLERAREHHQAGHLREALYLYRRIASTQADCVDAILAAATIELQIGDRAGRDGDRAQARISEAPSPPRESVGSRGSA
jgi:hypothetical protein